MPSPCSAPGLPREASRSPACHAGLSRRRMVHPTTASGGTRLPSTPTGNAPQSCCWGTRSTRRPARDGFLNRLQLGIELILARKGVIAVEHHTGRLDLRAKLLEES